MADSRASRAVMRGNEHVAPVPGATELSADYDAVMPARRRNSLRPSQVPVLSRATATAGLGVRRALSAPGEPLDHGVRGLMEDRFGSDFSDVRIFRGTGAAESARALAANAYTVGNRIVFAAGKYDPASASGQRVLAHELAHVVQQRSGPVSGLPLGSGVTVSEPQDSFEEAAESKARDIMSMSGTPSAARAARPADGEGARIGAGRLYSAAVSSPALTVPVLSVQCNGGRDWPNIIGAQGPNLPAGLLSIGSSLASLFGADVTSGVLGALSGGVWTLSAVVSLIRAIWPQALPDYIKTLPDLVTELNSRMTEAENLMRAHNWI
jgi:Domain of unknown function (DUF4157)